MEEEKYQRIRKLVTDVEEDRITYDEFDKLVSDEDYEEWARECNKKLQDKLKRDFPNDFK